MKRLIGNISVLAVTAFASVCLAQGYVGGSFGNSDANINCAGTVTCDNKDTGFKVFGGYMFTPNFGVEGAYASFGTATASVLVPPLVNVEIKGTGFGAFAVGVVPIDQFSVFGKLGVASIKAEGSGSVAGFGGATLPSETHTDVAWGVGAGYNFTKNFGIRAEWERFRGKLVDEKFDIDFLSIGVKFTF